MSDKLYYQEQSSTIHLRVWALGQMVWGAFLAGAFLVFFLVAFYALVWIGSFLPEESKQAPSPYSYLEQSVAGRVAVA
jgi:hypothetical protein